MTTLWHHTATARLHLDLPVDADARDLFAIHSDPESWRHFPAGRHTDSAEAVAMVRASERFSTPMSSSTSSPGTIGPVLSIQCSVVACAPPPTIES